MALDGKNIQATLALFWFELSRNTANLSVYCLGVGLISVDGRSYLKAECCKVLGTNILLSNMKDKWGDLVSKTCFAGIRSATSHSNSATSHSNGNAM